MSTLLILAFLVLLLYGSKRGAVIGKGLAEGVKTFRKTLRDSRHSAPAPAPQVTVTLSEPKLLPAKGETSPAQPPSDDDDERR